MSTYLLLSTLFLLAALWLAKRHRASTQNADYAAILAQFESMERDFNRTNREFNETAKESRRLERELRKQQQPKKQLANQLPAACSPPGVSQSTQPTAAPRKPRARTKQRASAPQEHPPEPTILTQPPKSLPSRIFKAFTFATRSLAILFRPIVALPRAISSFFTRRHQPPTITLSQNRAA
jgi:hypothetical protein